MGGFKKLFSVFRGSFKPGLSGLTRPALDAPKSPYASQNANVDPVADYFGAQWIRNADNPLLHDPSVGDTVNFGAQVNEIFRNVGNCYVGQSGAPLVGKPCAVFKVWVVSGDPAVSWATAPVYLQGFNAANEDSSSAPKADGVVPQFVTPVPIPPGQAYVDFGLGLPFNYSAGGISFYLSTTRDTLTKGPTGTFMVNWAFYAVTSY